MVHLTSSLMVGLAGLASIASAHPGHDHKAEAAERAAYLRSVPLHGRSLAHCERKLKARGITANNIARRESTIQNLRMKKRSSVSAPYLKVRDLDDVLATDHHSNKTVNLDSDPSELFEDSGSCIVQPEVTQGPYFVAGELVRENMVEDQAGVPLYLDIQLIDVNTCEPVPEIYTDFWHCNATGVYSGVVANGNGNTEDESNLDSTFLRGIQPSDEEGVIRYESIFPGHYTGRATHIHGTSPVYIISIKLTLLVLSHAADQVTVLPNGTLAGLYDTRTSHVGQIFFDQDLITEVEKTSPYAENTQELTTNAEDSIMGEEAATGADPVVNYVLLGDDVSQGVFAWISLGINATLNDSTEPAAWYTEEGGVENENSGPGGGSGGAPPGGAPPGFGSSSTSGVSAPTSSSSA